MDLSNISNHMSKKLQAILPAIGGSHQLPTEGLATVNLSLAENVLLREEVMTLVKASIRDTMTSKDMSYPTGFGGSPELLQALAGFFNNYFHPSKAVQPDQIVPTSGAGSALDALLCTICDPEDFVLVLGPCWEGFGPYFLIHANARPITVTPSTLKGATEADILDALKNTYRSTSEKHRIKAVVVTNPNNPLGRCYPADVLRDILLFCNAHGMHFISDEVYAMSSFTVSDSSCHRFVSALSLLDGALNIPDLASLASKVHVGCIISQTNQALRLGSGLASYWQTSSLTSVVATSLLNSHRLPDLLRQNSERLGAAYHRLTDGLARLNIRYIPAAYGLFVLAKVGAHCHTREAETAMARALALKGLIVAPGQKFSCGDKECGWFRVTFSTSAENIDRALRTIEAVLGGSNEV